VGGVQPGFFGLSVTAGTSAAWLTGRSSGQVKVWKMTYDLGGSESASLYGAYGSSSASPALDVRHDAFSTLKLYLFYRDNSSTDLLMRFGTTVPAHRTTTSSVGVVKGLGSAASRTELLFMPSTGSLTKSILYGRH
jgi:hypothetical protein